MGAKKTTQKKVTKMKKPTEIQIVEERGIKSYEMKSPADMVLMATVLKDHIVKHNLYTGIQGKNYVNVEGWQFAGGMLGIIPRVVDVKDLSTDTEIKWLAEVELVNVNTNEVVSRGFSICSDKETKGGKKMRTDEYAVCSMAQTRAVGKAYRTCIAWVMKVAGYEGTPSDEMDVVKTSAEVDQETPVTVTDPEAMVQDAVGKIKRMRSLAMVEKVEENIKGSENYNDKQKAVIQKTIDEKKTELAK